MKEYCLECRTREALKLRIMDPQDVVYFTSLHLVQVTNADSRWSLDSGGVHLEKVGKGKVLGTSHI